MTVKLTIIRGPKSGQSFEFDEDEITIGSGRANHLIIQDNDVSTRHCRLLRVQQDYDIEDLGSRYGTFVNGQPVKRGWILSNGCIIELGGQIAIEYQLINEKTHQDLSQPILMKADDPGSQPCLVLVEESQIKAAYLLQSELITVGRSVENDVIVQETDISREHMRLFLKNGRYFIEDLNSRNGTYVNGVGVTHPIQLYYSDVIRLGASTQLHFIYRSDLPESWDPLSTSIEDVREDDPTSLAIKSARRAGTKEMEHMLAEGMLEDHILIAYAREDWEAIVAPIMVNLNDSKQKVWVDQHLLVGSDEWRYATERAHSECWLLIVVVSPSSLESDHVKDQYRYFYNREKPIIVVEYKPVEKLPIQLVGVPRIPYDPEAPGNMFRLLLAEIMHLKPRYANND